MWGQWYIRSNLMLDVASLGKIELLPWEPFGLAKKDDLSEDDDALIDRVADLSSRGDAASIDELRALCDRTSDLRVPDDLLARVLAADATGGTGGNPLSSA